MTQIQRLILGPPGCGKTTFLLNQVEEEMANGAHPSRIAYVSFTRKAAGEAVSRALSRFNVTKEDFLYFRTLHSLAYQQLALSPQRVMNPKQYKEIGEALGLTFSEYMDYSEGLPVSAKSGDQMIFLVAMARATLRPLAEQYKHYLQGDVSWFALKRFYDTLEDYKRRNDLLDFSDMLDRFVMDCPPVDVEVAFIDEAQDLSMQQWRMVRHAFRSAKRVYIAGDDDQAIYRWSGADVDSFLALTGERTILNQSYRLPSKVFALCAHLAQRISRRIVKVWQPRDISGEVNYLTNLDHLDWRPGTHLLLARNRYLLTRAEEVVRQEGIPYTIGNRSSVDPAAVEAIKNWERLRRGDAVPASAVRGVYAFLRANSGVKRGFKQLKGVPDATPLTMGELREHHGLQRDDIWHEALLGIPAEEREFYLAARRRGEKLSTRPRVHLSTIHGVKGGEADHVTVISDMAARTYAEFQLAPDDEHRVAYVAASRAKETLSILLPQTARAYQYA